MLSSVLKPDLKNNHRTVMQLEIVLLAPTELLDTTLCQHNNCAQFTKNI